MKATGIVRRIDDLGRVVIPKEIRRTLRIKEGTPLEIFTDKEGEIILKKYSPIGELNLFAKEYAEALAQATGMVACITDHDQVVAAAGQRSREFAGKEISRELDRVISDREMRCFHSGERGKISLVENQKENAGAVIVQPIICDWRCDWFSITDRKRQWRKVRKPGKDARTDGSRVSRTTDGIIK